jgi:hypothetical protein
MVGIVDLAPGRYVAICVSPSPDGAPHVMKGMAKELTVAGPPVPAPRTRPDVVARLTDYDFVLSRSLSAGRQVIQFTNDAGQIHEAFIARLQPGKTAADLTAWEKNPATSFPAVPMGGITGIEPGAVQSIVVDLEPGRYVLICFVPDAGDGRPHHAHGMVKEIDVPAPGRLASTPR